MTLEEHLLHHNDNPFKFGKWLKRLAREIFCWHCWYEPDQDYTGYVKCCKCGKVDFMFCP
jgi:hypothetical protein